MNRAPKFLRSSRISVLAMVLVAWPQLAFADAPPGAYLDSTNKSQKSASSSPAATAPTTAPDAGYQSMSPSAGAPPAYGQMPQGQWNGQPQPQVYPPQSQTYSGFAQQTYTPPPTYQPPPNYGAPPVNPGGENWQADYPSLGELNGGGGAPPYGQGTAPPPQPPQANWGQSQAPQAATTTTKNTNPKAASASTDKDKDDNTAKTISTIANTVLPIATSVVTTAIMNKMMYGSMMPGYGGYRPGYGYPYGGSGYPMGGYGYNRPGMMNGLLGGNGSPGLMNMHF